VWAAALDAVRRGERPCDVADRHGIKRATMYQMMKRAKARGEV
jgi:transposase-like protein